MAMARLTCCLVLVASWTELAPGLVFLSCVQRGAMGQVEHRVFAKWVSRRHTEVLKTTSNAARPQECDSRSHEMWNTKKALFVCGPLGGAHADTPLVVTSAQVLRGRGLYSSTRTLTVAWTSQPGGYVSFDSGEYCCLVCFQHSLLIHHNSYLCSTDSCGPQLSSTSSGSRRALGLEPLDDISDRGQRRMQKRLLSEYTSLGPHFLLDRVAHRAPMPASTGWSRTRGSTRRHSHPRAGRLVADCRHCLSTVPGSRSPTIACPPRAANCRRPSCVRPGFPVTRSTRAVSESDIRRTSSHHLRVEREGADGAHTFIIARGFDAGVDLYSAVLSSRHSVENPEGCMALDSESSHGACFCTRKHATSTHSA